MLGQSVFVLQRGVRRPARRWSPRAIPPIWPTESLRLINLRYQAGESTALEVVDAQNTLTTARNAYSDSEVRYRVAIATLQTLTGNF